MDTDIFTITFQKNKYFYTNQSTKKFIINNWWEELIWLNEQDTTNFPPVVC